MKNLLRVLLPLAILFLSFGLRADDVEMGIMTGNELGTYYQFGQDMRKLVAQYGIDLKVYPSRGSFENILTVYDSRSVPLGLAQSDVVIFMQLFGEPKVKALTDHVKVVFPLYTEEAHLLAKNEIGDFAALAGKKVAIDRSGSGTAMTASVLFELSGVKPAEVIDIGGTEALTALRKGEIDAMFYVAGYPVSLFRNQVSKDDKLHLAPITDKNIIDFYGSETVIPAGTYSWQDQDVKTIDVMAGLVTFDYDKDDPQCVNVRRFAKLVRDHLAWLKEHGHEKWKSVDLDAPVDASLKSACSA